MTPMTWLRIGAIVGAFGVTLGAFGAHYFEKRLDAHYFEVYQTAVTYQMYHAPALLAVGLLGILGRGGFALNLAGWSLLLGVILFSGSLYVLSVSGMKWLGAVAPIGGLALILGWIALAVAAGSAGKGIAVEV